ncbi:sirohydrochlorin chelatase [Cohnella lupini]|uniref:Sirohydrochlorin ferrochelatase n=1 Tax=Cohnella lupini TaxID=1294267 RepID=A0A3D9IMP8_9BACL|nr:CbiX/SirB N-terminal domain-containing protein [Cohnella lupini]RED63053.1 sirohydrochlorin ferrochelatase [Cohnella lupini]
MRPGLLVISHGSREAGWVALVDKTIDAVRTALGDGLPVETAFLELVEGRLIQDGIDRLETVGVTHLLALPLFVSSGSTHVDEIGWALGAYSEPKIETDLEKIRIPRGLSLTYGKPMDDDPELISVVLNRLREMSSEAGKESVLLIGHGSQEEGFQDDWERILAAIAGRVMDLGGYDACSTALLLPNQVPEQLGNLRKRRPSNEILVLPLFLSEGYFTKEVIPRRLESASTGSGAIYRYDGRALMPHEDVENWIIWQARNWAKGLGIEVEE